MTSESPYKQALYLAAGSALLFTVPVIEVARQNLRFFLWSDFWVTILVVAGIPGLVILPLSLLLPRRLYIAATFVVVSWLFSIYYEIAGSLGSLGIANPYSVAFFGLLLLIPLGLVGLSVLPQRLVSSVVGTAGYAIFALSAGQFAVALQNDDYFSHDVDPAALIDTSPLPAPHEPDRKLPDIIYVVPDRYANAGVLKHLFDHDNSAFLEALQQRGFAVAKRAQANYLTTRYSLSSSMNMQYIEPALRRLEPITRSALPLYSLLEKNIVIDRLNRLGYRYVHFGSWWDGTSKNQFADRSIDYGFPYFGGELGEQVRRKLFLVKSILNQTKTLDRCSTLKRQLSFLETVGGDETRPTFIFAHVLAPHDPILVNAEGECIPPVNYPNQLPNEVAWKNFTSAYSGYVTYLNRRFLEIFDRHRTANPNPFLFIIQADEGPYPRVVRERSNIAKDNVDWRELSDSDLAMKFGILNALYLGESTDLNGLPEISDTLSPVNNWRIIFSRLEGKLYPLLPDRHFIYPGYDKPYVSIEITDRLKMLP